MSADTKHVEVIKHKLDFAVCPHGILFSSLTELMQRALRVIDSDREWYDNEFSVDAAAIMTLANLGVDANQHIEHVFRVLATYGEEKKFRAFERNVALCLSPDVSVRSIAEVVCRFYKTGNDKPLVKLFLTKLLKLYVPVAE